MLAQNPVTHLERFQREERQSLASLDTPQHSLERRAQIEQLLRVVQAEIAEIMGRNVDAAQEA